MKSLLLALFVATLTAVSARASIVVVAPTSTVPGSLQITAPITFTISTAGAAQAIVLDEWVTADASNTASPISPNLSISINGTTAARAASLNDNAATTLGAVTANDGFISFNNSAAVTVGNTVTLLAGNYTLAATTGFNPLTTQTFNGNLFVATSTGTRLSANVSGVPEPSTWALVGIGALGALVVARRRRLAA